MDLEDEISYLISLKQEGGYWDFKRQWHTNNSDLLHDIICMANNLEDKDSYIIIGIDEEKDFCTYDLKSDPNRKNTQNLVDFLRDKKFAGGIRPIVFVKSIGYCNDEIDVIVIKNKCKTPYFLSENYQGVFANNIYTREFDTNTPKTKSASLDQTEYLWRKRFGIDKTVMERLQLLLDDNENWIYKSELPHYYKFFPEFHIEYETDVDTSNDLSHERYCGFYLNPKSSFHSYKIYYHSTILFDSVFLYLDEARITLSEPQLRSFEVDNKTLWYYYFEKDSIYGKMLKLFTKSTFNTSSRGTGEKAFLIFENEGERLNFENYVIKHFKKYSSIRLDPMDERAIKYEEEQQWYYKSCESMAKLYQMFLSWNKDVKNVDSEI